MNITHTFPIIPDKSVRQVALIPLLLAGLLSNGYAALKIKHQTSSGQSWVITTNRATLKQEMRTYTFPESGVFVSNEFEGARLNNIIQTSPTNYTVTILPENYPINDSPWYAFKIWSPSNQTVQIKLAYEQGKHRYPPKISHATQQWETIPHTSCIPSKDRKSATLTLDIGPQPLLVAAQEMFTSQDFKRWIDDLCQRPYLRSRVLGQSTLGKPIYALELTEASSDAQYLLVLGRQHPPELTGTFALKAFVSALCADSALARKFRQQFKVIIVPVVNPDGVDAGHWRHNVNGVDLNRDWGQFNQLETRIIRDEFLKVQQSAPGKIRFGVDFHSTGNDVFYAAENDPSTTQASSPGAQGKPVSSMRKWFQRLQDLVPEYDVNVEESPGRSQGTTLTSIGWMRNALNIPAVTYEAGDQTDRELIQKVATQGAVALMELLLENP